MRVAPTNWDTLFSDASGVHITEYKLVINDITYYSENMQSKPIITKPLLDKPAIGRVCSATMTVAIRPIANTTIPKAARVLAYCRLTSQDGATTTDWKLIGKFNISSRSGRNILTLNCRDDMVKAGQTYLDKSSVTGWPVQQSVVVNDIARIMGVSLDDRTVINTGTAYRAQSPGTEALISEVLSYIGVCNGGNWIITEEGKLRLIPFASPSGTAQQALGTAHNGYDPEGIDAVVSRVTLTDQEDETYTAGNDTGIEITGYSPYANQTVTDALLTALSGVVYRPFRIDLARINPLIELGDTISATDNDGNTRYVVLHSIEVTCNMSYTASLESQAENDAEEEIPYQTAQELQTARSIRADRTYYGASLNRGEGLVVRKLQGDNETAKVIFNADEMSFYQGNRQILYFDAQTGHWKMSGSIEIETLNSSNITTISDINGRTITIEETVDGITVTDPQTGQTLIDGGAIVTDNLFLNRLFPQSASSGSISDSYVEMQENGLNFILGQSETIGIGYYSSSVPLPYMIFGAGSSPRTDGLGMIKKYANGIWIGDTVDRDKDVITRGTGIFVDTNSRKLYKYVNGSAAELADTSNVVAVFG